VPLSSSRGSAADTWIELRSLQKTHVESSKAAIRSKLRPRDANHTEADRKEDRSMAGRCCTGLCWCQPGTDHERRVEHTLQVGLKNAASCSQLVHPTACTEQGVIGAHTQNHQGACWGVRLQLPMLGCADRCHNAGCAQSVDTESPRTRLGKQLPHSACDTAPKPHNSACNLGIPGLSSKLHQLLPSSL
jgi:hypothetical protein